MVHQLCVYRLAQADQTGELIAGLIPSSRTAAIDYVKLFLPGLSGVDAGRLKFSVNGKTVPDFPRVWETKMESVRLLADEPVIEVTVLDDPLPASLSQHGSQQLQQHSTPAPTPQKPQVEVHLRYTAPVGTTPSAVRKTCKVNSDTPLSDLFNTFAREELHKDTSTVKFLFKGLFLDDHTRTCAEAGVVGAEIHATNNKRVGPVNAVAGPSTGPGTRSTRLDSTGAAPVKPRTQPPSTRLPPPSKDAVPAAVSTSQPALKPTAAVNGKRRASGNASTSDSIADGRSPVTGEEASKKKARVVKDKAATDTAAVTQRMRSSVGEGGSKAKPAEASLTLHFHMTVARRDGIQVEKLSKIFNPQAKFGPPLRALSKTFCNNEKDFEFKYNGDIVSSQWTPRSYSMSSGDVLYGRDMAADSTPAISIFPPTEMNVTCVLTVPDDWEFDEVWPRAPDVRIPEAGEPARWRAQVQPNGDLLILDSRSKPVDAAVQMGLLWTASPQDDTPCFASDTYDPAVDNSDFFDDPTAVLLAKKDVAKYVDGALKALGLPSDRRKSFQRAWSISFRTHDHVLLRFVPQPTIDSHARIRLTLPSGEKAAVVTTRIRLLFEKIDVEEVDAQRWEQARENGAEWDFEALRDAVGVPSRERQENERAVRVVECGAAELNVGEEEESQFDGVHEGMVDDRDEDEE